MSIFYSAGNDYYSFGSAYGNNYGGGAVKGNRHPQRAAGPYGNPPAPASYGNNYTPGNYGQN